jgi:hypothetical protein
MAMFAAAHALPKDHDRRSTMRAALATKWAVVGLAASSLTLGTAAAAYTGVLPGPLQAAADQVVGTPAVDHVGDEDGGPPPPEDPPTSVRESAGTGPDATGEAAFGLCTAYAEGGLDATSDAYRALETAAGGADAIDTYCADIDRPGPPAGVPASPDQDGSRSIPPAAPAAEAPVGPPADRPSAPPAGPPADAGPPDQVDDPADGGRPDAIPGEVPDQGAAPDVAPRP